MKLCVAASMHVVFACAHDWSLDRYLNATDHSLTEFNMRTVGRSPHSALFSVVCRPFLNEYYDLATGALTAQVHGHDFSCVAALPPSTHAAEASGAARDGLATGAAEGAAPQFTYVSGSEEKVLRVLEAPQAFYDTLALARGGAPSASSQARACTYLGSSMA